MPAMGGSGGGAQAGDVRAGGAVYEIAGRDGLSPVLDKLKAKTKGFTDFMKRNGAALMAGGFGVLGGGVAGAVTAAARAWDEIAGFSRSYTRELEKAASLSNELSKSNDRIQARQREWI